MPVFCYIDLSDGARFTSTTHGLERTENVRRDYSGEGVGINLGELRKTSAHNYDDSLFLPTAKEFESAKDPDGSKGIRNWNETHEPRDTNKNPKRPKLPSGSRAVF